MQHSSNLELCTRTHQLPHAGYINKALTKYQHPKPVSPQHDPYKAAPIQYGARVQRVEVDTTQPLTPKVIKCIHGTVGNLLYYARAVDPTILAALSTIAACQSNGTQAVANACHQLLDYVGYTSQCRHLIQSMQHGTVSTHGRVIPF